MSIDDADPHALNDEIELLNRGAGVSGWVEIVDRPKWAIGRATGPMQIGAQHCTRDGRRIGNAVTIDRVKRRNGNKNEWCARVVTDAGSLLLLNHAEINELFHPPRWRMKVETHPAAEMLRLLDTAITHGHLVSWQRERRELVARLKRN